MLTEKVYELLPLRIINRLAKLVGLTVDELYDLVVK